jgi:hypothetical protein
MFSGPDVQFGTGSSIVGEKVFELGEHEVQAHSRPCPVAEAVTDTREAALSRGLSTAASGRHVCSSPSYPPPHGEV